MKDDAALQRLVEMFSEFFTTSKAVEEDLEHSLTKEFLRNFQDILFTKHLNVFMEWEHFFHVCGDRMLSSPEMYLRYVFNACRQVALTKPCIFERFLDALALIIKISIEMNYRTRVNFYKLIPDIVMVLYKKELKKQFLKYGGFSRLVEYVNDYDYADSVCYIRDTSILYARNTSDNACTKRLNEKLVKILAENQKAAQSLNFVEAETDKISSFLADCVLKDTKVELPPLPSYNDSMVNPPDLVLQREAESDKGKGFPELAENVRDLGRALRPVLVPHLKSEDATLGQMLNTELYEKIIEEVIKHNQSRSSSHEKPRGRIQIEAHGVLDHLNGTIRSLIQVLDDFDKE